MSVRVSWAKTQGLPQSLKCGETCGFKLRTRGLGRPRATSSMPRHCREGAVYSLRSVLGALPTHLRHCPKPAPFTSLGYRQLGSESRGEKSKCGLTLRVSTVSGPSGSQSLWQPACRAIPRRWLPGIQRGRQHCSLCGTKVGPDQGGAGSAATPARKQLDLAQCLHPHTPPGEAVAEPRGGGPCLQLQEAENRHLPHQAPLIIKKKPQGLHLTLIMVEGR